MNNQAANDVMALAVQTTTDTLWACQEMGISFGDVLDLAWQTFCAECATRGIPPAPPPITVSVTLGGGVIQDTNAPDYVTLEINDLDEQADAEGSRYR